MGLLNLNVAGTEPVGSPKQRTVFNLPAALATERFKCEQYEPKMNTEP